MFDLKVIPIHHQQGKPIPSQAGFQAYVPPRRASRSRSEDLLIVSLITSAGKHLSPELQGSWLADLADTFFKTSGSVTSALRILLETLNLTMMEKNLKSAGEGGSITGAINLAAVHRRTVYIAQSGLTHAYALTQTGVEHFYDASKSDRGLGLSRTPTIRYYHAELGGGGYLFMTNTPPETWTEEQLCKGEFPNLEQVRRRLLNQASPNLRLDLVQILPGEGRIKTVQGPAPAPEKMDQLQPATDEVMQPILTEDTAAPITAAPVEEISATQAIPQDMEMVVEEVAAVPEEESILPGEADPTDAALPGETRKMDVSHPDSVDAPEPQAARPEQSPEQQRTPEARPPRPPKKPLNEQVDAVREEGLKGLSRFFAWWRKARADVAAFFSKLLSGLGLKTGEGLDSLSNRTLFIIAVLVPLAVVAIAMSVYLVRGRTLQYEYYMEQAQLASTSAQAMDDLNLAREGWSQTLLFLDTAESYRRTTETTEMRAHARRAMDVLDGAVRLSYHPAIIGSLYDEIYITRIISYGVDLYMLDQAGGRVIHATRGSQGYQIDVDFNCQAGNFSGGGVDPLVDMASLPINNPQQAHILAVDAIGNAIFCSPGKDPVVQSLPRGEVPVGGVARIASEGSVLYVLDPSVDTVRVYRSINGQFLDAPTDFFAGAVDGVKPSLSSIVDLAVNGPELYLLRADGMQVNCVSSGLPGNPVTCENPVPYVDGRPGKEDQPVVMPESRFVSVLYTAPPDPAVNILDADNADIFRFSLRFRLYQRMRSDFGNYEITSPAATAFTIGVDRIAFIAFGHQVFYAYVE